MIRRNRMCKSLLLLVLAFCGLLLCSCGAGDDVALSLSSHSDYPMTDDLDVMAETASFIVVGAFEEFTGTWNMSRNPDDPSLPSEDDYAEGELYRFRVDAVLKGEIAGSEIEINIPHSRRITGTIDNAVIDERGIILTPATEFDPYSFDAVHSYYMQPSLGESVMLFLSYSQTSGRYFPAIEPYVIAIRQDGSLQLKSNFLKNEENAKKQQPASEYFFSEGGQKIEYRSNMPQEVLEDNISHLSLEELLREMGFSDEKEIEQIRERILLLPGEEESPLPPEELPSISRHSEYPVSDDLHHMYASADAVVIGRYLEFEEAWNMFRNPENPAEESTTDYFEGHIYSFAVESNLKGQAGDEIRINIPYKRRYTGEVPNLVFDEQGQVIGKGEGFDAYEFDYLWEFYMEPDPEESYILFLSYSEEDDRYFPAIEPYVIALSEDGLLELRSNLLLPEAEQAEKFQTEFRTESGKPMLFEISAYPIEDKISGMSLEEFLLELESPAESAAAPEQAVDE